MTNSIRFGQSILIVGIVAIYSCILKTKRTGECIRFKTKTDLRFYIGWREEIREAYEKQALIEEHSKNTIALLKEVQRDINDTNDRAIEYYEQAVEYLGEDDNE